VGKVNLYFSCEDIRKLTDSMYLVVAIPNDSYSNEVMKKK
jgi:hypothetical protein